MDGNGANRLDVVFDGSYWFLFCRVIASYAMQHGYWEAALEVDNAPAGSHPVETDENRKLRGLIGRDVAVK
jgi:hypothetical protein